MICVCVVKFVIMSDEITDTKKSTMCLWQIIGSKLKRERLHGGACVLSYVSINCVHNLQNEYECIYSMSVQRECAYVHVHMREYVCRSVCVCVHLPLMKRRWRIITVKFAS